MQIIELKTKEKDKNKIIIDGSFLTVRRRKEIKASLAVPKMAIKDDRKTLAMLAAKYKVEAPTEQEIFEDYSMLVNPLAPDQDDAKLFDEIIRACMKWQKKDGTAGDVLTVEEFEALPYEIFKFADNILFTEAERNFLVVTPEPVRTS